MNTDATGEKYSPKRQNKVWIILVALLLLRLLTLGLAPLYDPSEGRYAEIAREMLASGNWVTPSLNQDTPFWGKPPLHFWMTAFSLHVFGNNAFAARLPAFFSALLVLTLTGLLAWRKYGRNQAFWAMLALLSTGLFFISSAYVVTDMTLTFCITGALSAFFMVDRARSRRALLGWKYFFFLCLGLGMLAKGPVALVLCAIPIFLWTLLTRRWKKILGFPWFSGGMFMLLVCAPWYALAEQRTPGFLDYFFIHEHILRYLKTDYGDLYANGHAYPYGTIWGLAALGLMPWTPLFLWSLGQAIRRKAWKKPDFLDADEIFLVCWAVAPMLFFSISRNIVVTYTLPAFPALAILGGKLIQRFLVGRQEVVAPPDSENQKISLPITVFSCILLFVGIAGIYYIESKWNLPFYEELIGLALAGTGIVGLISLHRRGKRLYQALCVAVLIPAFTVYFSLFLSDEVGLDRSTRDLITQIRQDPEFAQYTLTFFDDTPHSAEFYSSRHVESLNEDKSLLERALGEKEILIIKTRALRRIPPESLAHLRLVMTHGPYSLFVADQEP
jgi:4-amino-4-deoxy-L-arabinose transferase-like glycosyltransferase